MKKLNILTVTHDSKHTSAPLSEYTLARRRYFSDETTTLLAFYRNNKDVIRIFFEKYEKEIPNLKNNLEFLEAKGNIFLFIRFLRNWFKKHRKSERKSILHLHQPRSGLVATLIAKLYFKKIPIIYTVHNNFINFSFIHRISLYLVFSLADKIIFVSNDAKKSFSPHLNKFILNKSIVIQNGVDIERIENIISDKTLIDKQNSNNIKFISTGRFAPQKNQKFLIEVLENYKGNWSLDIYGSGDLKSSIDDLITKKGLASKIKIIETVPREEFYKAVINADLFISTALWEGLPIAVMEIMFLGLPCVVSNITSHKELGEAHPGLTINDFDVNDWHRSFDYWSSLSRENRKSLGLANREVIKKSFTLEAMQKNYRSLYERIYTTKN